MTSTPLTTNHTRLGRLALASVVISVAVGSSLLGAPNMAQATSRVGAASITQSGTGDYSDLKVTVDQTENLTNQVVRVSWTGGVPTPVDSIYSKNYLQMFQCWGDATEGPDRTQCQFGGFTGDPRGGADSSTSSRQVSYGSLRDDPAEPIKYDGGFYQASVPFKSVTGKTIPGVGDDSREFFNSFTTNEIPYARTSPDGTGEQFFEVQTALDAPGLGCGTPVGSGTTARGRGCWLVVVPRGDRDVNGTLIEGSNSLYSSPLEYSNWQNRIVIPLGFQAIAASCKIGAKERETLGQEGVEEALNRWQPKLCESAGTIFSYSQVPDSTARANLVASPSLSFLSNPVSNDRLGADHPAVYAPVAANATVIAFNIYSNSSGRAPPPEVTKDDGKRLTQMNLNQRLVLKLLSQSYRLSLANALAPEVANNPEDIVADTEFRNLNPNFTGKGRKLQTLSRLLMTVSNSDSASTLWKWVLSDKDARDFLAGKPDPYGMTINPNYKNLDLAIDRFPRNDLYCADVQPGFPQLCEFDAHPYAADDHDAARATSRGDTLGRLWDPNSTPPSFKRVPLQPNNAQGLLCITDAATAARYGLSTANLVNASKNFVAPTSTNMLAAIGHMKEVAGTSVLQANPSAATGNSYPLTNLTYAATVPTKLTAEAAKDYSDLIKYAVGPGQTPGLLQGQLPDGYAPLPNNLRAQAVTAADHIVSQQKIGVVAPSSSGTNRAPGNTSAVPSIDGGPVVPVAAVTALPDNQSRSPLAAVVNAAQAVVAALGLGRFAVLVALILALGSAFSGPILYKLGGRAL